MAEKFPQLAISALTNTPFIRLSKSKKIEIEYQFQQAVMQWITEGKLPGAGKTATRELKLDGVVHFEISLKQFVDYKDGEALTPNTPPMATSERIMPENKTIKVRIKLAINEHGEWCAEGSSSSYESTLDMQLREALLDARKHSPVTTHVITAEIPVPSPAIQGAVTPSSEHPPLT